MDEAPTSKEELLKNWAKRAEIYHAYSKQSTPRSLAHARYKGMAEAIDVCVSDLKALRKNHGKNSS